MTIYFPVVYNNNAHQPMQSGDKLDNSLIQVSTRAGNQVQFNTDGIYVGSIPALPIAYVNTSTGADVATNGSKSTPFKSLDYAVAQIVSSAASTGVSAIIALQCGQAFTISQRTTISGDLTITFYGDTQYGDFNSSLVNGLVEPWYMEDLVRPTITNVSLVVNSTYQASGLTLNGSITLQGVSVILPNSPNPLPQPSQYSVVDFIQGTGTLLLNGCTVITNDTTSQFGFIGITARSKIKFEQFGSQFLINNRQISSTALPSPSTAELLTRAIFIKFYSDYAGGNHNSVMLNPTSINSSNGSGLLELYWSEAERQIVTTTSYNLPTFPVLSDPTYGLAQYFTSLRRDQQSRPLNVVTSRLF